MDIKDLGWERQTPEYETGDYWFDGSLYITNNVDRELSKLEITLIYADIKNLVQQCGGQDYLQVYLQKERGLRLFFIDQVTRKSLQIGEQPPKHNYATLLFDWEY